MQSAWSCVTPTSSRYDCFCIGCIQESSSQTVGDLIQTQTFSPLSEPYICTASSGPSYGSILHCGMGFEYHINFLSLGGFLQIVGILLVSQTPPVM